MTIFGQIFAGVSAVLFMLCIGLGMGLYHYRAEAADYARDLVVAGVNKQTCDAALNEQRKLVEEMRHKKVAPKVITKTKYQDRIVVKYVDRNITQGECRETSAHIDAARRLFP